MCNKQNIGFVFTNYNNTSFTRLAIDSIYRLTDSSRAKVVVVDNASREDEIVMLDTLWHDFPDITVIRNEQNLGYFAGLNCGIEYLRAKDFGIGAIVIGNNDLTFPADFIESIDNCSDTLQRFPVLCPDILTLDDIHQNPHVVGKISPVREFIWDIYYASFFVSRAILLAVKLFGTRVSRTDNKNFHSAGVIAQGYGACFVLSPLFFSLFDRLWSPTFLMGEEFFLSMQVMSKGYSCYYDPRIIVYHHDHATCGKLPSKTLWLYARDSHRIYRHFVKFPHYCVLKTELYQHEFDLISVSNK